MPHKHNADRRHHIPKMSFKVRNWPVYEFRSGRRATMIALPAAAGAVAGATAAALALKRRRAAN